MFFSRNMCCDIMKFFCVHACTDTYIYRRTIMYLQSFCPSNMYHDTGLFLQMHQVLSRMFPFGRGLCHAYWAPNFWVFYIIADKGLAFMLTKLGFHVKAPTASFTGGLVGDSSPFSVLPQVLLPIAFIQCISALRANLFFFLSPHGSLDLTLKLWFFEFTGHPLNNLLVGHTCYISMSCEGMERPSAKKYN